MNAAGFLPAAAWSGLALLAPLAARPIERALSERAAAWASAAAELGPWLHGLGPPFLALFSGAVPARYLGLYGSGGWMGWVGGALFLAALWLAARVVVRRAGVNVDARRYDSVVLDEPRWALYRGAGWLVSGAFYIGALIGLALAALEWGLTWRGWRSGERSTAVACFALARVGTSGLVFALTGNLWLTVGFQVGLALLVEGRDA